MKQLALIIATLSCLFSGMAIADDDHAISERFLRHLYDRSDLIIDATVTENCEGGIGSGPLPGPEAQIAVIELLPRVKVNRIFKGAIVDRHPFLIAVSIRYSDKAGEMVSETNSYPVSGPNAQISGDVSSGWFRKGDRYVFFLEDRLKREPKSHLAVDDEIIRFRSFDPWFSYLPTNEAIPLLFKKWETTESAPPPES